MSPKYTKGSNLLDEQSPEKTGELEPEIREVLIYSLSLVYLNDHKDVDNDRLRRLRKPSS